MITVKLKDFMKINKMTKPLFILLPIVFCGCSKTRSRGFAIREPQIMANLP